MDGATQYLSNFRSATVRYDWKQKVRSLHLHFFVLAVVRLFVLVWVIDVDFVVASYRLVPAALNLAHPTATRQVCLDTLLSVALNAVQLHRVWKMSSRPWRGLNSFRTACSRQRSFGDSIMALCTELAIQGTSQLSRDDEGRNAESTNASPIHLSPNNLPAAVPLPSPVPPPLPRAYRAKYFNTTEGKTRRLTGPAHCLASAAVGGGGGEEEGEKGQAEKEKKQPTTRGRCLVCKKAVHSYCPACSDVYRAWLCKKRKNGDELTCFRSFHSEPSVPTV